MRLGAFGASALLAGALQVGQCALAQEGAPAQEDVSAASAPQASPIARQHDERLSIEAAMVGNRLFLSWRPRHPLEQPIEDPVVQASVKGAPLPLVGREPVDIGSIAVPVALLLDVGREIDEQEAAAFVYHALQLIMLMPETMPSLVATEGGGVSLLGALETSLEERRLPLMDLAASDEPGRPVAAFRAVASLLAALPADRRAVFLMTDAAACDAETAFPEQALTQEWLASGVIANVALYGSGEPSPECLGRLQALVDLTGGTLWLIGEDGTVGDSALGAVVSLASGETAAFDLAARPLPPWDEDRFAELRLAGRDHALVTQLPLPLPRLDWWSWGQLQLAAFGSIIGLALALVAVGLALALSRGSVAATAALDLVGETQEPIPVGRRRVLELRGNRQEGQGRLLRAAVVRRRDGYVLEAGAGAEALRVNGRPGPPEGFRLASGDLIELAPDVHYRFWDPAAAG